MLHIIPQYPRGCKEITWFFFSIARGSAARPRKKNGKLFLDNVWKVDFAYASRTQNQLSKQLLSDENISGGYTAVSNLTMKKLKQIYGRFKRQYLNPRAHVLELINQDSVCAEIGVWKGDFSRLILKKSPKKLYLIDPWMYFPEFKDRIYGDTEKGNSQQLMDNIHDKVVARFSNAKNVEFCRETSDVAAHRFADNSLDFVYIDGNHNYEFVKQDLETYITKTRVGGYITGDDYIFKLCPKGGPKQAIDEVLKQGSVELLSIKNNQYILKKLGA
jgi:hypothetical protein